MRVVDPPLADLGTLRQPLTAGERRVLDWFLEILPASWEIYIQPHLNGLRPDFVLLHPRLGIAVYEVKDWSLSAMRYFVRNGDIGPELFAERDGRSFSLARRDPVAAVDQYKQEIHDLYVPSLPTGKGLGAIVAGVIFTNATTDEAVTLLEPLREARGHCRYPRLYPVVGSDLLDSRSPEVLRTVLCFAHKVESRISRQVATELRHWLVEPTFSAEQRVPLQKLMTPKQKSICLNAEQVASRRLKGPAGSGKSAVLAGRAAEIARQGKRVLIVTFNITLINYLLDLAVQYAQSGSVRQSITALNFHYWCKRVAFLSGNGAAYAHLWGSAHGSDASHVLDHLLAEEAQRWASSIGSEERWDALLVDEGQDFRPSWWKALQCGIRRDGAAEALLVADSQQNVYGVASWTEAEMVGAGFRGRWITLDASYRLSPSLCRLASDFVDRYLPDLEDHRPKSPQGEIEYKTVLRWRQIDRSVPASVVCVEEMQKMLALSTAQPIAVADLVCIVDSESVGRDVVELLDGINIRAIHTFGKGETEQERQEDGRRKKLSFYKGDSRVKVTTIHSFKGWESRALVVHISRASNEEQLSLAYTAITRLKRDDHGCFLTLVCSEPALQDFGKLWPQ